MNKLLISAALIAATVATGAMKANSRPLTEVEKGIEVYDAMKSTECTAKESACMCIVLEIVNVMDTADVDYFNRTGNLSPRFLALSVAAGISCANKTK